LAGRRGDRGLVAPGDLAWSTQPFYAPFANIVARPSINGGVLDFPLITALLAYVLLHVAVRGLLRLLAGYRSPP
jgi:hypothetical protein